MIQDALQGEVRTAHYVLSNMNPSSLRRVELLFAPENMEDLATFDFVQIDEILSRSIFESLSELIIDIADRPKLDVFQFVEDVRTKMPRLDSRSVLRLPHV